MRNLAKHVMLLAILFGFPVVVFAQHVAHPVTTSRPAALPRRVATGRPNPRTMNATTPPGNVAPYYNGNAGWGGSSFLGNNVPGLGFSYGAGGVNSLNQSNLGVEALINPATQAQIALALRFLRASPQTGFGGGLWALPEPYYEGYDDPNANAAPEPEAGAPAQYQQQPSVIIVQAPGTQAAPASADASALPPVAASGSDGSGEFILVKRDGTQINAGAFFHQGNQLVYVTPSGARRTMPFTDLDVDSTVLANQERGTDLQLPL